jgi:hypothetical protein
VLAAYTHGGHDGQLISVPIGALAALRTFVALTVGGGAAGVPSVPLLILSSDKAVLTAADFVYDCDGKAKGCDGGGFFGCARLVVSHAASCVPRGMLYVAPRGMLYVAPRALRHGALPSVVWRWCRLAVTHSHSGPFPLRPMPLGAYSLRCVPTQARSHLAGPTPTWCVLTQAAACTRADARRRICGVCASELRPHAQARSHFAVPTPTWPCSHNTVQHVAA